MSLHFVSKFLTYFMNKRPSKATNCLHSRNKQNLKYMYHSNAKCSQYSGYFSLSAETKVLLCDSLSLNLNLHTVKHFYNKPLRTIRISSLEV